MDTMDYGRGESAPAKSLVVVDREGEWEGIWVAGYMPTAGILRELCRTSGNDAPIPRSVRHRYGLEPTDLKQADEVQMFDQYACALGETLSRGVQPDLDLFLGRTLPMPQQHREEARRGLREFFIRPGGQSHHEVLRYGETVYCCNWGPTQEEGYPTRIDRCVGYLGLSPLRAEDAVSDAHWWAFAEARRNVLSYALKALAERGPPAAASIEQVLRDASLTPPGLDWHVYSRHLGGRSVANPP
jgi:hypothetical protein